MTDPRFAGVRKLSYFMPLGKTPCEACGNTVIYNLAVGVLEHEDRDVACDRPFPKVDRTPEQEARIAAAQAEAVAKDKALRDRHAWMLANAADPILRALVEAHAPHGDDWPKCPGCPEVPNLYEDLTPDDWPCPVWLFISDRMGDA